MPVTALFEIEVWCAEMVMKLHIENIKHLIINYLRDQAYESGDYEIKVKLGESINE